MTKTRRKELAKFIIDLGKLMFAGTVIIQIFPGRETDVIILVSGLLSTLIALVIGLAIIPEEV